MVWRLLRDMDPRYVPLALRVWKEARYLQHMTAALMEADVVTPRSPVIDLTVETPPTQPIDLTGYTPPTGDENVCPHSPGHCVGCGIRLYSPYS